MARVLDLESLRSLRHVGDAGADQFISGILQGVSESDADKTLATLMRALRGLEDVPEVRGWVEGGEEPPARVSSELVARGQQVFTEWSLEIVAALFCASLPFAYAAAQGVEVLDRVSQLAEPGTVARRIAQTGQMLLDISEPNALGPGGRGYETARTVRLLHAAIRSQLTTTTSPDAGKEPSSAWDTSQLGVPVNQEDLLGTLLSFTTVVFQALDHMGIAVGTEAEKCYLHLWATVGELLGIESTELVLSPDVATRLTERIALELHAPSAAGVRLMNVLLGEMELSMPWGLRKLPRTLVRHLGGNSVADMIGVPPNAWWGDLLPLLATLNRVTARFPAGRAVLQAPSRLLGRSMIRMWVDRTVLGEQPDAIHIDPETIARLGIRSSPDGTDVGMRGRLRGRRRRSRLRRRRRSERSMGTDLDRPVPSKGKA